MEQITNEQLVAKIQAGENTAENMLQLWQQTSAATPIGAVYDRIPANNYNYHSMESGERTREKWPTR